MKNNIKRIINFYFSIILKNSKKINLSVTNRCNMRCKTCNIWKCYKERPEKIKRELELSDYKSFFRKFNYWNWISFTGGEPFLRKDLTDIITNAIQNCKNLHTVSVPTNGYLTSKIVNDINKILEAEISSFYVTVSLDGSKDFHDKIRGKNGSFEHAIKTFKKLKTINDKRFKVHFEYTISKYNQGDLSDFINKSFLSVNDFIISIAQNSFFYNNIKINCKPDKKFLYRDIRFFLSKYKIIELHDIGQKLFLQHILNNKKIPCIASKNTFYMDSTGNIFPCIFIKKQIGDSVNGMNKKFENSNCFCYTPCESYLSLLLNW
jgi:MoaA/NifB/PqqE/SkfB family radical SAM enzyme